LDDIATAESYRDRALSLKPDFTAAWYLEHRRFHQQFRQLFIDGARKAGLPLGEV
jgi:hypothetical protein